MLEFLHVYESLIEYDRTLLLILILFALLDRLRLVLYNARWWTWHIRGLFQCIRWQFDFIYPFYYDLMIYLIWKKISQLCNLAFVLGEFWCENRIWYDTELQNSAGHIQQAENWQGNSICYLNAKEPQFFMDGICCFLSLFSLCVCVCVGWERGSLPPVSKILSFELALF